MRLAQGNWGPDVIPMMAYELVNGGSERIPTQSMWCIGYLKKTGLLSSST